MNIDNKKLTQQIKLAKQGNQLAFNYLLDTYWDSLYAFLLQRNLNENDAEDITIRSFSKAFEKISTFNEEYQFKTWLFSISKNIHIDFLRKKKTSITTIETTKDNQKEAYTIVDTTPSPEDKIITEQNLATLLQHIKKLKPKYQKIIQLRYFQELSYKEIAIQMDASIANVKVTLLRAKKLLAAIIIKV